MHVGCEQTLDRWVYRISQYFRCYSPVAFGKKTDRNGDYIKKYLPALRKFPPKYIYEPWTAPKEVGGAQGQRPGYC